MDIAYGGDFIQPSTSCKCYKVAGLTHTILDTNEVSRLKDRYVLREQLGWGRFGVIRACSDKLTGEVLACKTIAKDRLVTQDDLCSVKLEIEIMTNLSGHPNVVNLKAVYEEEDYVHLLMELCAGGELFHQLEKHGTFSEHEARIIFRQLMQVVQFCHDNGIVHRDLKPENVLLANRSSSSPIKLADFGLATYITAGHSLHGTVGSPFYIAPEVLAGGYNQSADVWSAGVILYILLSGMPPFWGKTKSRIFDAVRAADLRFPSDSWDHISTSAKDLVTKMLCVDPCNRLSAADVLDHPWMQVCPQLAEECIQDDFDGGQVVKTRSLSVSVVTRDEDYSFNCGSPETGGCPDIQSPIYLSLFSSFRVDDSSPCTALGGFSFGNNDEPGAIEISPPIISMPSFAFFSSCSTTEIEEARFEVEPSVPQMSTSHGETLLGKLFGPQNTSASVKLEGEMVQKIEFRRDGINFSKVSNIHKRRNHTIGLGELDQLNIVVSESVIRWASCTHIPTATSLRLSLVC